MRWVFRMLIKLINDSSSSIDLRGLTFYCVYRKRGLFDFCWTFSEFHDLFTQEPFKYLRGVNGNLILPLLKVNIILSLLRLELNFNCGVLKEEVEIFSKLFYIRCAEVKIFGIRKFCNNSLTADYTEKRVNVILVYSHTKFYE